MRFFRFASAVLVLRSKAEDSDEDQVEKGNCQSVWVHHGHEKGDKTAECPEDKPVPKDKKPDADDVKKLFAALKKGKAEYDKAMEEVCCTGSMVGFVLFSILL